MPDQNPIGLGAYRDLDRDVFMRCRRCEREVRIGIAEAIEKLGAQTTLKQAELKVKCAQCGGTGREGFMHVWLHSLPNDHVPDTGRRYGPTPRFDR